MSMESCIGKTYKEITKIFLEAKGDTPEHRKIDAKWREIGSKT